MTDEQFDFYVKGHTMGCETAEEFWREDWNKERTKVRDLCTMLRSCQSALDRYLPGFYGEALAELIERKVSEYEKAEMAMDKRIREVNVVVK